jgi:hypothetical protein
MLMLRRFMISTRRSLHERQTLVPEISEEKRDQTLHLRRAYVCGGAEMRDMVHEFEGMDGVKGKLTGVIVRSVAGFNKKLRIHRIVSAAGDNGSVNVYVDDAGKYRCEFHQYRQTIDQKEYRTKASALQWLKEFLPKVRK